MTSPERPSPRGAAIGLGLVVALLVALVAITKTTAEPSAMLTTTTVDFSPRSTTTTTIEPPVEPVEHDPSPLVTGPALPISAPGWSHLGTGPMNPRAGFSVVDAGGGIMVVGGSAPDGTPVVDAAVYVPGGWTGVLGGPPGPDPATAWTGTALLVHTGESASAWDPEGGRWSPVDPGRPVGTTERSALSAAATDTGVVVLVKDGTGGPVAAVGYGPDLGCCRDLGGVPAGLSYAQAHWTGERVLVLGGQSMASGEGVEGSAVLLSLDPSTGAWEPEAPPPFPAATPLTSAWVDGSLVVWGDDDATARWTPEGGWDAMPAVPIVPGDCPSQLLPLDEGRLMAMRCGEIALWYPRAGRWARIVTPGQTAGWPSSSCRAVLRDGDATAIYVWCAPRGQDPSFWRLEPYRAEVTRYSNASSTDGAWSLFPLPAATSLADTALVWTGSELLVFCGHGVDVECTGGWSLDPVTGEIDELPAAAYPGRSGQAVVWTGSEMLVWRGVTTAYDPSTRRWETLATSPGTSLGPAATWTGTEMVLFGSDSGMSASGVAYDRAADAWREIEPAPLEPVIKPAVAWSGEHLYVFGGTAFSAGYTSSESPQAGAAYDPTTDSWRLLPELPGSAPPYEPGDRQLSGAVGAFVDGRFVVFGANWAQYAREGDFAAQPTLAGFAYDPSAGAWREIAPPPEPAWAGEGLAYALAATAHGSEMAVFLAGEYDGDVDGGTMSFYDPATDRWRRITGSPSAAYAPELLSGLLPDATRFMAFVSGDGIVVLRDPGP